MLSALLLQLFTATSPPAFAAPLTATFSASADATVQAARPTQAFGSATSLEVDGSPVKRILLKFTVSGIGSQTVRSATLRIYCIDPSPVGGVFTGLGTAWQESTVTWNNAPAATTPMVRALGRVSSRGWYQVDLTPLVTGDGMIGISIASSSNDGADYASREAGPATAPVLVVQYDAPSPSPSPPPSPSPSPSASPLFSPSPSPSASPESDPVLLSVGDIATCSGSGDELTATLLDGMTGTVATLGDQAYPDGSQAAFADCYDPSWGRHRQRTLPAAGNHEYMTGSAGAYFNYFGAAAGDPARGYYAYTLGTWRIIVLNSNCSQASGCGVGSAQEQWLRTELAASGGVNVLAYWHHPRFSSGFHGSDATYEPFWRALYEAGADVVLAGHDHDYERFAPQDPTGILDQPYGIREFVVGTGGAELRAFNPAVPNSEVRDTSTFGILELTLSAASYTWRFLSAGGGTFSDAGQAATHPAPPPDGNAPSVPTGLTASEVSASTIAIAWAAASDDVGVTGYEVSRDGAVVAISAATGFIDHDVLAAQTYEYRVRARDAAGNWSVPSTALSVTTPAIPGGVTAMISSDSFVAADKPTSNYGTAVSLEVDGSPQKAILLQVNVSGLNGRGIRSARLYLYCIDPSNVGGEFHRVPTTWSESTVTWNTTPAADPGVIATLGPVTAGSWYVVDLTGAILADGTYGFKIVSASTNGADYVSRDGISLPRPYLVIETP